MLHLGGIVFAAAAIIFGLFASSQKGPVGSRFSGKRAADGSDRQGPRPGHELESDVRWRRIYLGAAILSVVAAAVFEFAAFAK